MRWSSTANFFKSKIQNSFTMRGALGYLYSPDSNVCQLIYGERDIFQGFIYDYYNVIVIFQKYSCGMHLLDVMLSEIFRIIFYHNIGIRDTSQSQTHKAHQWKTFSCMATRLRRRYWSKKWKSMSKSLKVRRLFHRPEAKPAFAPSVSQGRSVLNMFC